MRCYRKLCCSCNCDWWKE